MKRRNKILKGKAVDLTEHPDSEVSDGGYSHYSDIEVCPNRERYNIKRSKRRRKYPKEEDFIDPNQERNLFNNLRINNIDPETSSDEEDEMNGQRNNSKWSLKDLSQFHGKRDGIEHPSTHLMEFGDTLEAMGIQV